MRLFNSSSENQYATVSLEGIDFDIGFKPFEVKTFIKEAGRLAETGMI